MSSIGEEREKTKTSDIHIGHFVRPPNTQAQLDSWPKCVGINIYLNEILTCYWKFF